MSVMKLTRVNLLEETLWILKKHGKSPEDVRWVGSKDGRYAISWEEFTKIADIEYNNGYGGQEIAMDLVVVGDDWWLERGEYDGAEWWEFKTLPVRRKDAKKFSRIVCEVCWESIAELNSKR